MNISAASTTQTTHHQNFFLVLDGIGVLLLDHLGQNPQGQGSGWYVWVTRLQQPIRKGLVGGRWRAGVSWSWSWFFLSGPGPSAERVCRTCSGLRFYLLLLHSVGSVPAEFSRSRTSDVLRPEGSTRRNDGSEVGRQLLDDIIRMVLGQGLQWGEESGHGGELLWAELRWDRNTRVRT